MVSFLNLKECFLNLDSFAIVVYGVDLQHLKPFVGVRLPGRRVGISQAWSTHLAQGDVDSSRQVCVPQQSCLE